MAKSPKDEPTGIGRISIDALVAAVATQIGEPPEAVRAFIEEKRKEEKVVLAQLFGRPTPGKVP